LIAGDIVRIIAENSAAIFTSRISYQLTTGLKYISSILKEPAREVVRFPAKKLSDVIHGSPLGCIAEIAVRWIGNDDMLVGHEIFESNHEGALPTFLDF
jgi:hypothetical protein